MTTLRPRAALLCVLTTLALAALSTEAAQMPSSRSDLYYRLGGSDPASRSPNPSATTVRLGLAGTARLNHSCGKFDFGASFETIMSKFAAIGFDESLRLELKRLKSPVRTTVICPFYIDTGMFAGVKTRFPWRRRTG